MEMRLLLLLKPGLGWWIAGRLSLCMDWMSAIILGVPESQALNQ